jgi:hypothetical protein
VLAGAAGDERGRCHADAHGERVHEDQQRLGERDRGGGVRAEVRDEEDVGDGEDALQRHLQHHGDGEEQHGAA